MVDTLLAPHFLGSGGEGESYLDYYDKLIQHQTTNLLVAGSSVLGATLENDEMLTKSHQMLICLFWLERIDARLPDLIATKFNQQLKAGVNILDLVPQVASTIEELLHNHPPRVQDSCLCNCKADTKVDEFLQIKLEDEGEHGNVNDNTDMSFSRDWKQDSPENVSKQPIIPSFDQKCIIPKLETSSPLPWEEEGGDDSFQPVSPETSCQPFNPDTSCDLSTPDNSFQLDNNNFCSQTFSGNSSLSPAQDDSGQTTSSENSFQLSISENSINLLNVSKKKRRKRKLNSNYKIKKEKKEDEKFAVFSPETLTCEACLDYSTCVINDFRLHQKEEHGKEIKWCRKCNLFIDPNKVHPNHNKHAGNIACNSCGYVGRSEASLRNHNFKVHAIGSGHQCEICGYKTSSNYNIVKHSLIHNTEDGLPFMCNECGDTFNRIDTMRQHIKKVHEGFKLKCEYCDYTCVSRRNVLNEHMKREHLGTLFEVCIECGVKVKSKRDLLTHKATIHGKGKIYPCTKCDYKAVTNQRLQEHDRKVHEKVFFKCILCPSEFVRKYALKRHMESIHKTVGIV